MVHTPLEANRRAENIKKNEIKGVHAEALDSKTKKFSRGGH
jgi:hypothetical protein